MSSMKSLEDIIESRKWIKNDIGLGRIQCGKLVRVDNEVIIILAHAVTNKPIRAKIRSILFDENETMVFYDGEFSEELEMNEFGVYEKYMTEQEWNIIFEEDSDLKLESEGLISDEDIVYIDVYENKYNYNKINIEELLLIPAEA